MGTLHRGTHKLLGLCALVGTLIALVSQDSAAQQQRPLSGHQLAELSLAEGREVEMLLPDHLSAPHELPMQIDGQWRMLRLEPHSIRTPSFRLLVTGDDGQLVRETPPPPRTVRGTIQGFPHSEIAGSLAEGRLSILMRLERDGPLWAVQPLSNGRHALYRRESVVSADTRTCGTFAPHDDSVPPSYAALEPGTELKVAELALEADYEYYQLLFESVGSVVGDLETIVKQSRLIYSNSLQISFDYVIDNIVVRTTPNDPYEGTDAEVILNQMRNTWNGSGTLNSIPRATAHLFTGRNLDFPVLGIAYVNVMCNKPVAYGLTESRAYTNLIQRVGITAHEIGHNWSAPHCNGTSDCALMCASLPGCTNNLQKFGAVSTTFINSALQAANCLTVDVVPLIPILASATPDFGPPEGGGTIDLFGVDLLVDGMPTVSIGDVSAEIMSASDTVVTVTIPPGEGGSNVDIVLLSDNGLTSLERAFRYTLNVGAGDDITSYFDPLEIERYKFTGLGGSLLTAQVIPLNPEDGLISGMRIYGPDDEEIVSLEGTVPKKGKPLVLKKFELPSTGEYRLEAYAIGITWGDYQLKTKVKLTKSVKQVLPVSSAEPEVPLTFSAEAGTLLKLAHFKRLAPKGKYKLVDDEPADLVPEILSLTGPEGPIDLSGILEYSPKGKFVRFKKLELMHTGDYTLLLGGLDDSIGFGRARLKLKVPKPDTESIVIDA
ncbi:MAG: hypothetical protein DHS20C15_24860 [Planctomycetota bacterium]|nr:MAG: hypothetical protein DHS20C15_24860 [Planctomycetota bacterium]